MPSGITHILLMKHLQEKLPDGDLKMDLAAGRDFLQAGAVGPDLPYASIADDSWFFSTDSKLADSFHYRETNRLALKAFQRIRAMEGELSDDEKLYLFCFFLGFTAHIIADGTVHPFVRDMVGHYEENKAAHRKLEMDLDVLLFHYLNRSAGVGANLNDSNMHEELNNIVGDFYPETGKVMTVFSELILDVYGENHSPGDILGWVKGLYRMLDIAEGDHHPLYRDLGFLQSFLYSDFTELEKRAASLLELKKPADCEVNFLKREMVHFFHDIVPRFYEVFIPVAEKAYDYVFNNGPELDEADVAYIDLDTGRPAVSRNDLDLIPTYWS